MADIPNHVDPGDIIKSTDFNGVVDVLQDLTNRVALLENSAKLTPDTRRLAPGGWGEPLLTMCVIPTMYHSKCYGSNV